MRRAKNLRSKLKKIKMLIMDVDGVLTDGFLIWTSDKKDIKHFHVHDGYGLAMARKAGLILAIITARESKAARHRAEELHLHEFKVGHFEKLVSYQELRAKYRLRDDQIAYMGDDWFDLPVMRACGIGVAVANARPEVKKYADYITTTAGGNGAVREFVEMVLEAQGKLERP
jgi:3-deoxy-D-manno-octulosonate 8-phosphate phosphatase (KDO 8-P phosphatase)